MENKNIYHIVIATDDNYAIHARTLIRSALDNEINPLHFHVLSFNLSNDNIDNFNALKCDKISLSFIPISDEVLRQRLLNGKRIAGDRSLATYARLLIPELMDQSISRCVYLDVDGLILNSMAPMFELNLDNYAMAGVIDINPMERHYAVGLEKGDVYINAGMIIWNLDFCRINHVVDQFAEFIQARDGNVDAMDQGTINGVLSKYIKPCPLCFNVLTPFYQLTAKQIKILYGGDLRSDFELEQACNRPIFVHFTPNNTTRPWVENCKHPLRNVYWKYREDNAFVSLQKDKRSKKIRFLSVLFYLLPIRVYRLIINLK